MLNRFTLWSFLTPGFVVQVSCWASHVQRAWLRSSVQRTARSEWTWPWFTPRSPPLSVHVPNNLRDQRPACLPPSPEPTHFHLSVSCLPVCFTPPQHASHSTVTPCSRWRHNLFTGTFLVYVTFFEITANYFIVITLFPKWFFVAIYILWYMYLFDSLYIHIKSSLHQKYFKTVQTSRTFF